jgi:hypothetical protein
MQPLRQGPRNAALHDASWAVQAGQVAGARSHPGRPRNAVLYTMRAAAGRGHCKGQPLKLPLG